MYEFYYNYLKPKYADKIKLCYMNKSLKKSIIVFWYSCPENSQNSVSLFFLFDDNQSESINQQGTD